MLRFILVVACLFIFLACQKNSELTETEKKRSGVLLKFSASSSGENTLPSVVYNNPFNESYSVNAFRFYVHNISLIASNPTSASNEHFLLDLVPALNNSINLTYPAGNYTGLRFTLGVDSIRNYSGAQTGALDPSNGMFWTWNSGYIMAKLEGNSSSAATPENKFEYHIGGYSADQSVIRNVELAFPDGNVELEDNTSHTINIKVDLDKWFSGDLPLRIAEHPVITTPGELAIKVANNYQRMFSVISVTNTE